MHFVCTAHAPHVHGISTRLAHQAAALLRHGWLQLLYLSVAVTATANLLQAYGQQRVGAAEAAIIYTMDPVYGALFAWLLLGERLHTQGPYICTHAHTNTHRHSHTDTNAHAHQARPSLRPAAPPALTTCRLRGHRAGPLRQRAPSPAVECRGGHAQAPDTAPADEEGSPRLIGSDDKRHAMRAPASKV